MKPTKFIIFLFIIAVCVVLVNFDMESAESQSSSEYAVKVAFIYNFGKFIDWPKEAFKDKLAPIKLFVIGDDPFREALDTLRDKTIQGRELIVSRVQRVDEIEGAHILFISSSEKRMIRQILESTRNRSVLTISEVDRFCQMGGIINFILVENKIQFEINSEQAKQNNLKISSQLLNLARIVRSEF